METTVFSYGETNTPRHLFSLRNDDDDFAILRFSSGGDSSRDSSEFPAAAAAPDRPTGSESLIFFLCVISCCRRFDVSPRVFFLPGGASLCTVLSGVDHPQILVLSLVLVTQTSPKSKGYSTTCSCLKESLLRTSSTLSYNLPRKAVFFVSRSKT